MRSFDNFDQDTFEHYSPLASTEEKSIHDNINLNKQSLEKGLRNRPNQHALVDRGILRNPGKAFSDKMSQLDLAKKRDKLKTKIANRPAREELERKLILQDQTEIRQKKFDQIKQRLDDSINNRPGSLELVDKHILQVDRLLASRIQSGELTYPKVCGESSLSGSVSSNHSTPLPSISEIDIHNTLSELSDLQSFASTSISSSKPNTKNLQYSCKKTHRVGRYSFHNIEFRPAAQKAREYQQSQLVQFEEIQEQRNPNLKRLHCELAIKSHPNGDIGVTSAPPQIGIQKYSLLHRLNVHELKSECKIRMISCSNIPKVQLVEKLLPYESEILASHTSFESAACCCPPANQVNRRSMPLIKTMRDFSPPEQAGTQQFSTVYQPLTQELSYVGKPLIHSHSEPAIQNYIHSPPTVSYGIQILPLTGPPSSSSMEATYMNLGNCGYWSSGQLAPSSTPFVSYHQQQPQHQQQQPQHQQQQPLHNSTVVTANIDESRGLLVHAGVYDSGPNNQSWTHIQTIANHASVAPSLSSSHSFNDDIYLNGKQDMFVAFDPLPANSLLPPAPADQSEKFQPINLALTKLIFLANNTANEKLEKVSERPPDPFVDCYETAKMNLLVMIRNMVESINREIKYEVIDLQTAQNQLSWLQNLRVVIEHNMHPPNTDEVTECVKSEKIYPQSQLLSQDYVNSHCNGIQKEYQSEIDDMDILNFDEFSALFNENPSENSFLQSSINGFKEEEVDSFSLTDTPDFMNSSSVIDDFELMDDNFNGM